MLFACARASNAARTVSICIDWFDPTGTTVWIESSVKKKEQDSHGRAQLPAPLVENWLEARSYLGLSNSGDIPLGSIVPSFDEAGAIQPQS